MHSSKIVQLKIDHSYRVIVHGYLDLMKAGLIPRPESMSDCDASWVEARGSRTFGFKSSKAMQRFRRKYLLKKPHKGDKRYVRHDVEGRFKEVDDVGRKIERKGKS